jgi:hypothetical protein
MDYKNINENWKKFVDGKETIEEGWKEKLAGGIGLLMALTTAGTMGSAIAKNVSAQPQTTEQPAETGGVDFVPMPLEADWQPAPGATRFIHVNPASIPDDYLLPGTGETKTAGQYREELRSYPVDNLDEFLYGKGAATMHASGRNASTAMHPELNKPMLAPTWSLVYEIFQEKAYEGLDQLFSAAKQMNVDPYEVSNMDREKFKKRVELLAYQSGYEIPTGI